MNRQTEEAPRVADAKQADAHDRPISMHEDIPLWHDCCCCEAEPRWIEIAPEVGIDLEADWDEAVARLRAESH